MKGLKQLLQASQDNTFDHSQMILIDKENVIKCQINPQNIICSICHNILWNPVMCGIANGCHSSFCKVCIQQWFKNIQTIPCPNCKNHFFSSPPHPLLKIINCPNKQNGCESILSYDEVQSHLIQKCPFVHTICLGCNQSVLLKQFQKHKNVCQKFIIQCLQCQANISKKNFLQTHIRMKIKQLAFETQNIKQNNCQQRQNQQYERAFQCFNYQIGVTYESKIQDLQNKVEKKKQYFSKLERLTNKILQGDFLRLQLNFHTRFVQNFQFTQPTLIKSSFNQLKQKYDFLHFYIKNLIHINSTINVRWQIKIQRMKGNILMGFCNSMNLQSIDLIVNKYGQIKIKKQNQNKYKIIKKEENFRFKQGDLIDFRFIGIQEKFIIQNKKEGCTLVLGKQYLQYFYSNKAISSSLIQCSLYPFYSFDTQGDQLVFL